MPDRMVDVCVTQTAISPRRSISLCYAWASYDVSNVALIASYDNEQSTKKQIDFLSEIIAVFIPQPTTIKQWTLAVSEHPNNVRRFVDPHQAFVYFPIGERALYVLCWAAVKFQFLILVPAFVISNRP